MKKLLLLLIILLVAFAVYNSRPKPTSPQKEVVAPVQKSSISAGEVPGKVTISITPRTVIQGEPALVMLNGLTSTSSIKSLSWNGMPLVPFLNNGHVEAFLGADLHLAARTYPLLLTLLDGRVIKATVTIGERKLVTAPLGIPEKLGGNTATSTETLVSTLVEEGKIINAVKASREKLWAGTFGYPVAGPIVVTDVYGYSRQTGSATIAHKGTDFRAAIGTAVVAINAGKVAYTGFLRNYGNTVIVDHGTGLLSIYMHLSKISVAKGESVVKGQRVGLSGDTGYVLGPHLHLTIRINGVSIDPMKFYELINKA